MEFNDYTMKRLYIFLLLLLPIGMVAQYAKWELGFVFGGIGYQGDLVGSTYPVLDDAKPEYGLSLERTFSPNTGLRFLTTHAAYEGKDVTEYRRAFSYSASITQLSAQFKWDILGHKRYPGPYQFNKLFSPYGFIGFGIAYLDVNTSFPNTENETQRFLMEEDQSIGYPLINPLASVGLGLKLDLGRRTFIHAEAGTQTAFSDYLEGVSASANPDANDWLSYARVGLTIRFLPKDSDKDGIANEDDACPNIKGAWSALGCPDKDEDGVEDLEDLCPEQVGTRALNGCPDIDHDGVADREDDCPFLSGSKLTKGCPDFDDDGIADQDDHCPFLPGQRARRGCPILDTNADGSISDEIDSCQPDHFSEALEHISNRTKKLSEFIKIFTSFPSKQEVETPSDSVFDF
jgi:OOP family OmpA-OmpF porin